jgi:hypothetical protein
VASVEHAYPHDAANQPARSPQALSDDEIAAHRRRVLATEVDVQVAELGRQRGLQRVSTR